MAEVRVFAHIKAKDGKEQEMREVLLDLVKASRTEDGVAFYELFETDDGGEFLFNEKYGSREDFEAWTRSDAFRAAHRGAGGHAPHYLGPPRFEGFDVVQTVTAA